MVFSSCQENLGFVYFGKYKHRELIKNFYLKNLKNENISQEIEGIGRMYSRYKTKYMAQLKRRNLTFKMAVWTSKKGIL